ncbi:uncharacterized protein LOC114535325 [Dendronephthya gigantea]|uniref:uncharacterized protein LOC114535325 n=1 Tax=Dendronephthya gigantea TaxID=151771 RepID=UPI00106CF3FF|nr:uncharacterized protein LOC114535325 [Dendronephthya gigantea]
MAVCSDLLYKSDLSSEDRFKLLVTDVPVELAQEKPPPNPSKSGNYLVDKNAIGVDWKHTSSSWLNRNTKTRIFRRLIRLDDSDDDDSDDAISWQSKEIKAKDIKGAVSPHAHLFCAYMKLEITGCFFKLIKRKMAATQGAKHGGKRDNSGRKRNVFSAWREAKNNAGYSKYSDSDFTAHLLSLEYRRRVEERPPIPITIDEGDQTRGIISDWGTSTPMKVQGIGTNLPSCDVSPIEKEQQAELDVQPEQEASIGQEASTSHHESRLNTSMFSDDELSSEDGDDDRDISFHDQTMSIIEGMNADHDDNLERDDDANFSDVEYTLESDSTDEDDNEHEWLEGQCDHEDDEHDEHLAWFDRKDKDYQELQKIILNPELLASFKYYTRFRHTGGIECANSLGLVYTPKRTPFRYSAYKARRQLTAIDWNFHQNLQQAKTKHGDEIVTRKYNPRTRNWDLKMVKVQKGYNYIPVLIAKILKRRTDDHDIGGVTRAVDLNQSDPALISPTIAHLPPPPTNRC